MGAFRLDPHLTRDCLVLGRLEFSHVLLMNNPEVPWLILVPETAATELCDLESERQALLLDEVNAVSRFLRDRFTVDKLNVAAIGNVVRQLHVHVVGRRVDDYCWPGVVWGTQRGQRYAPHAIGALGEALGAALGARFRAQADG